MRFSYTEWNLIIMFILVHQFSGQSLQSVLISRHLTTQCNSSFFCAPCKGQCQGVVLQRIAAYTESYTTLVYSWSSRKERERAVDRRESSEGSLHNSPREGRAVFKILFSSSNSPNNTPAWAKGLLEAHEKSAGRVKKRLQLVKRGLKSRPAIEQSQEKLTQTEFKYKRSAIQYEVSGKVRDKLGER